MKLSKYNILVPLLAQNVAALAASILFLVLLGLLQLPFLLLYRRIPLLLVGYLFQSEELLPVQLVQFRVDVLDRVLRSRDNDVLAGISSATHHGVLRVSSLTLR